MLCGGGDGVVWGEEGVVGGRGGCVPSCLPPSFHQSPIGSPLARYRGEKKMTNSHLKEFRGAGAQGQVLRR